MAYPSVGSEITFKKYNGSMDKGVFRFNNLYCIAHGQHLKHGSDSMKYKVSREIIFNGDKITFKDSDVVTVSTDANCLKFARGLDYIINNENAKNRSIGVADTKKNTRYCNDGAQLALWVFLYDSLNHAGEQMGQTTTNIFLGCCNNKLNCTCPEIFPRLDAKRCYRAIDKLDLPANDTVKNPYYLGNYWIGKKNDDKPWEYVYSRLEI